MNPLRSASLLALVASAVASQAQITSVGVFAGSLNEGFESFLNYKDDPNFFLPPSVSIMGGGATLLSPADAATIYEQGTQADFTLNAGDAQVASGTKGYGLNFDANTFTLDFNDPVSQFGGYFNFAQGRNVSPLTFTFYGVGGALLGSSVATVPADTALYFLGFASTIGIGSVSVSGDYVVADDLRANPFAAPTAPGPLAALPFALMALRRRKRA